ncbi:proline-rich receptor-like protein kinase PERK8 isoform X2 [Aristolochia californica]|uniref:proline-rich receptor-like protein kinase PERK8 isoform X2 n=1 Tax=Aristolochia californica TaxID=171875 RepID=UPI0035E0F125
MTMPLAPIVGVTGGVASIVMAIVYIWFCVKQCKKLNNRNSETASSDPSALVEWNRGGGSSSVTGATHGARQFSLDELEQATKHFSDSNIIGEGTFGLVYKGLLQDGTVVAIKQRRGPPQREFEEEVHYLSEIWHRNLVTVHGYCQEDGLRILVSQHLPNGSICNHLYDSGQDSTTSLDFKQRLSIALNAARGLSHLHSLTPPLVHKNFKTSNVLVDENFIAKVADAGIVKLLERTDDAGSLTRIITGNIFCDPEVGELSVFSEASDVYSFGVFLLELVSGQETAHCNSIRNCDSLIHWVESRIDSGELIDDGLSSSFTSGGMRDLIELTLWCLNLTGDKRPRMEVVASKLEMILEKERSLTTVMGEGTSTVTTATQLFTG